MQRKQNTPQPKVSPRAEMYRRLVSQGVPPKTAYAMAGSAKLPKKKKKRPFRIMKAYKESYNKLGDNR